MKDAYLYVERCSEIEKCKSGTFWKRLNEYGKEEYISDKAPFDGFCPIYNEVDKTLRKNGYFWIQGMIIPKANPDVLVRVFGNVEEPKMAIVKMSRRKEKCEHEVLIAGIDEEKLIKEIKAKMEKAKESLNFR